MTKVIELRPDKSLINQNFQKYQFSSDITSVELEKNLIKAVYRQEPGTSQDSWLEARLYAFHNHLFKNPFDSSCWFIDERRDVWRLKSDSDLAQVHSSSISDPKASNFLYNPSIAFASDKITAITNGTKTLEILIENTSGERKLFVFNDMDPGVIFDAQYVKEKSIVIVAMCCISDVSGKKCSKLVLLSFKLKSDESCDNNTLELYRKQVLRVKGPIEYVHVEPSGDYMHMISQDNATFEEDSLNPVDKDMSENGSRNKEIKIPKYCWSQEEDSLTVWIAIPEIYHQERAKINVTATHISIVIKDTVLIQGDSQHRLDPDLTTWKREKDTVQLELTKYESGLMWNELIKGDTGGECLPNETLAAEIHNRLSHLCTSDPQGSSSEGQPVVGFNAEQLEECDVQGPDNFLQRIDLNDHSTTHLAMLGSSNHVIFTHKLKSGSEVCLRHDHHGIIWKPEVNESNEWEMRHVNTFPGFGYVEASKTNKKFCVSPPNGSYVAIVEHTRHAFLYEKPEGAAPVAKQRIVDLEPEATPIMGAVATNKHLILLTKDKIYKLGIHT